MIMQQEQKKQVLLEDRRKDKEQKKQEKQVLLKKRRKDKEQKNKTKARQTLKKYNTGKNKGQVKKMAEEVKGLAENASPVGFISLLMQANLASDWMYGLALMVAVLKDILDFFEFTGVLYFFVIVITLLASIFIALMMILGNAVNKTGGRKSQKMIKSWLILLSGTTIELIFGLDILPIETLTVLIIYALLLSHRKMTKKN